MQPRISQSLIKEMLNPSHCPKQVYYSFVEDRELYEPSESMLLGRYFESELLGACRGGQKQQAKMINKGKEKATAYVDCDSLIEFARGVCEKIGLDLSKGESQVSLKADYLSASIDHINYDLDNKESKAIYDVKWSATDPEDRFNGWGAIEEKKDSIIQSRHYVTTYHKKYGIYVPFYFLVFGTYKKQNWCRIFRMKMSSEGLEMHGTLIASVAETIVKYAEEGYKGNGNFNKCLACPFYNECPDKKTLPEMEEAYI